MPMSWAAVGGSQSSPCGVGTPGTDSLGWDVREGDEGLPLTLYLTVPFRLTWMVSTYTQSTTLQPLAQEQPCHCSRGVKQEG